MAATSTSSYHSIPVGVDKDQVGGQETQDSVSVQPKYDIRVNANATNPAPVNAVPVAQIIEHAGDVPLANQVPIPSNSAFFVTQDSKDVEAIKDANKKVAGVGILFIRIGASFMQGRFVVPRKLAFVNILTGVYLDFTKAQFVHPVTKIAAVAILGGLLVRVPPGVIVDVNGIGILGALKELGPKSNTYDGQLRPRLDIRGVAILGAIKVVVDDSVPPIAFVTL